jgi:hypothetical protein
MRTFWENISLAENGDPRPSLWFLECNTYLHSRKYVPKMSSFVEKCHSATTESGESLSMVCGLYSLLRRQTLANEWTGTNLESLLSIHQIVIWPKATNHP